MTIRRLILTLGLVAGMMPFTCSASTALSIDLSKIDEAKINTYDGATAEINDEGLNVSIQNRGGINMGVSDQARFADVLVLYGDTAVEQKLTLHFIRSSDSNILWSVAKYIQPTGKPVLIAINPAIKGHFTHVAIESAQTTEYSLKQLDFIQYSIFDKAAEAVKSFFNTDTYMGYTVNYVWGPRLTFNPVDRMSVYRSTHVVGTSFTLVVSIIFGIVTALYLWKRTVTLKSVFICIAAIWLIYDLRMTSELVSYVHNDYREYWSQEPGKRSYRIRGPYHDFAELAGVQLKPYQTFVVFSPLPELYNKTLRYVAYPSRLIRDDEDEMPEAIVVFDNADVSVNDQNELVVLGQPLVNGEVIWRYNEHSFIFAVSQ